MRNFCCVFFLYFVSFLDRRLTFYKIYQSELFKDMIKFILLFGLKLNNYEQI